MDDDRPDGDEVREAQRVTTDEMRRRAGAEAGILEPVASEEADEPTTAAADRVRLGQTNPPAGSSPP